VKGLKLARDMVSRARGKARLPKVANYLHIASRSWHRPAFLHHQQQTYLLEAFVGIHHIPNPVFFSANLSRWGIQYGPGSALPKWKRPSPQHSDQPQCVTQYGTFSVIHFRRYRDPLRMDSGPFQEIPGRSTAFKQERSGSGSYLFPSGEMFLRIPA
jgi:hypothetical protein